MKRIDRRRFMKMSAGIAAAVSVGNTLRANTGARPIRIGLIGSGGRGRYLTQVMLDNFENIQVPAVCDINRANLDRGLGLVERRTGNKPDAYHGDEYHYRKLLERDDLDAVMIVTGPMHPIIASDTMRAGKHVGCEVTAGYELNELQELVRTKEQTGKRYMLLENYLYSQRNMAMYNIVRNGIMGDTYYGECSYIHDCTHLMFDAQGNITWRGRAHAREPRGNTYSTHSLGPLCKWMGINEGDRLEYLTSMHSRSPYPAAYLKRKYGEDSPQATQIEWPERGQGGWNTTLIYTAKKNVIQVDYSTRSPIPNSNHYLIQGTNGCYDSRRGIYFAEKDNHRWENFTPYMEKYNHSYWRKYAEQAAGTGHGGGDYFVMMDFVEMVRQNREPWSDVYDAVTWSMIGHFSRLSLVNNGASQALPDFTNGKWKQTDWRKDNMNPGFKIS